jgi:retron-type reverse transcriptase
VKTYKNLYPQICDFTNLYRAYRAAARGKRGRPDVAAFEFDLESNLLRLREELLDRTYRPGSYRHFTVLTPKRRKISAAPFRDRVVHHALVRVIEPIFERRFIHDSYACRVGRGTHAALDRCQAFARRQPCVLQCDVEQFFPAVDHAVLRRVLTRPLADEDVLWLIDRILESGAGVLADQYEVAYFPGDDLLAATRPRGLPIGNLTSQFWANCLLNELDQFVKRELECRHYIRYVDDILLFHQDKKTLHRWRVAIGAFLAGLRLTLHEREARVYPVRVGIPFLGFRVYPDHRRLKRANGVRFGRRLRGLIDQYAAGEMDFEQLTAIVQGWVNHVRYGDTWGLRRAVLSAHPLSPAPAGPRPDAAGSPLAGSVTR